jgi:hypothetical protein
LKTKKKGRLWAMEYRQTFKRSIVFNNEKEGGEDLNGVLRKIKEKKKEISKFKHKLMTVISAYTILLRLLMTYCSRSPITAF